MYVIEMQKSKRRIPLIKQQRFYDKAMILRNKLLLWRLRNLGNINLAEIEYGYPELSVFDRRVQQVLTPIYYLSDEESRKTILEFATIQEQQTKEERMDSIEGEIFQAIVNSLPVDPSLKYITTTINEEKSRRAYTEKKIANIVKKILQFDIRRVGHENISTVMVSEKPSRLEDLIDYFGVIPPSESVACVANDANGEIEAKIDEPNATHSATATHQTEFPELDDDGIPIDT